MHGVFECVDIAAIEPWHYVDMEVGRLTLDLKLIPLVLIKVIKNTNTGKLSHNTGQALNEEFPVFRRGRVKLLNLLSKGGAQVVGDGTPGGQS